MGDLELVGIGHLALAAGLTIDVLLHKARPVSAVLWLAVLWAFPYVGALVYLTFGVDRVRRGAAAREAAIDYVTERARARPPFGWLALDEHHRPGEHQAAHIFRATDPAVRPFRVLRGNRVELLVDGDAFYPSLFDAIEGATSSIHIQTYIFARDRAGRELRDRLVERARSGVEVRLLYDRFGSTFAHFSGFFAPLRRAGADVFSISQANPLKGRFQINLRNHRKVAVVDGRVGFVGGMNFDGRNLTDPGGRPADRDYQVRVEGPAVADLQLVFVEDWHFASGRLPDELLHRTYFPEMAIAGDALVQVVPGGPDTEGKGLAEAVFGAIVAAERSVTIATPYFVPDEPILQALRYAAIRGVDVRLLLPARGNHWYAEFAARALYQPLLDAGVRIYERRSPFMHAKALVVDGVYAMMGSANLDYRSLHLNFELNLEVADFEFLERLQAQLTCELEGSDEVTPRAHRERPLPRRLVENFCRLFQPVL